MIVPFLGLLSPILAIAGIVVQIILIIWFVRTLNDIKASVREIADRLASIERSGR